jgi:hypothetical protein
MCIIFRPLSRNRGKINAIGNLKAKEKLMSLQLIAFLSLLVLSLAIPLLLFFLLRDSLVDLLRHTLKVEAGITFYLRSFLLVLFLSALSTSVATSFDLKPDARFMEYVWKGAEVVSSALEKMLWFIALYLVIVTALIATLKIKDDK